MREITISCPVMESPREFHIILARELEFPDWYGCNLDALHDQLTSLTADTRLILENFDNLGTWGRGFRKVFQDAEAQNPHFYIELL